MSENLHYGAPVFIKVKEYKIDLTLRKTKSHCRDTEDFYPVVNTRTTATERKCHYKYSETRGCCKQNSEGSMRCFYCPLLQIHSAFMSFIQPFADTSDFRAEILFYK